MPQTFRVLLVEDNRIESRQTQHWLATSPDASFEVDPAEDLIQAIDLLDGGGIDIVLLDLNLPDSRGIETFGRLHERAPNVPIVVLTGENDESLGIVAVQKGAADYLVKQEVDRTRLPRLLQYAVARYRVQVEQITRSLREPSGRVLGFVGSKGGVGTTTVALNVATALAKGGESVVLAELCPSPGSLAACLRHEPSSSLRSLLKLSAGRIGAQELSRSLCHESGGLRILFGSQPTDECDEIAPGLVAAIVKGLAELADYVVLDLPSQASVANRAAVELCHFIGLVTQREPISVRCGAAVAARLRSWGVSSSATGSIVVNQTMPVPLELAAIQSQLGCRIVRVIPWEPVACVRAADEGAPLVRFQPHHDVAAALSDVANMLTKDRVAAIAI